MILKNGYHSLNFLIVIKTPAGVRLLNALIKNKTMKTKLTKEEKTEIIKDNKIHNAMVKKFEKALIQELGVKKLSDVKVVILK